MWFDPRAGLAEIEAARNPAAPASPGATHATRATQPPDAAPRVAQVAQVARPPTAEPESGPDPAQAACPNAVALAYLAHLMHHGPATVGAAGAALGWGATRAWRAEAWLRAAGIVRLGKLGAAHLAPRSSAVAPR